MASDGKIRIEDCRYFLEGYNEALDGSGLSKLTAVEKKHFPSMMAISAIYLVHWCTALWYYLDPDGTNDYESIYYLIHLVRTMKWIETNKDKLAELIENI